MKFDRRCKIYKITEPKPSPRHEWRMDHVAFHLSKRFGPVLVATNNKAIAVVPVAEAGRCKKTRLVHRKQIKKTIESTSRGCQMVDLSIDADATSKGFPSYEKHIPKGSKKSIRVALDTRLLRDLSAAMGLDRVVLVLDLNSKTKEVCTPIRVEPFASLMDDPISVDGRDPVGCIHICKEVLRSHSA